ncbi:MAG: alpha-amylase family glycosyl hydrolase [Ignavibacteria bacterium]|nr:alpha-amylase family glycosyl hydrolase [Ignavibacteria bacterium]
MKSKMLVFAFLFPFLIYAQTVITTYPQFPKQTDIITITFDARNASHPNKIVGYTGVVYAHTGVSLKSQSGAITKWQKVIGNWGDNAAQPTLVRMSPDIYQFTISNPRNFYNVTDASQKIVELCFVLRSADGKQQTEDLFIPLYDSGISIVFNKPTVNVTFGDPMRSPVFVQSGGTIDVDVSIAEVGTKTKSVKLYVNGTEQAQSSTASLTYKFVANNFSGGKNEVKVVATDTLTQKDSSTFVIMKNPAIKNLPLPAGNQIGINKSSGIVALYAPKKEFVYVLNQLTDWKVDTTFFMNRYEPKADSVIWWIQMPKTSSYAFQYLIDGTLRVADPYSEIVLDPSNDSSIPSTVFPNLPAYPSGKTERAVTYFDLGSTSYSWKTTNFTRPAKEKLVIYETLVRDFTEAHTYKALKDSIGYFKKIGVNAIELMPINEFEGNNSWGYNPAFYFAVDKYYGPANELKAFIDECHANGIAVLMDIVLNHAYGTNPMVRMYWDNATGKPAANNPWFNQQSNFANPDAQWGYDFNHESKATQYFVDRLLQYWLTDFKFDGFRFDFTKGIGNNYKSMSDSWGSNYDADRIRLLKRMVNKAWSYDPTAIMIFEHLAVNSEEKELADAGILLWGNMNSAYNEATMGYNDSGKSNFEGISYKSRSWTNPNLVGYMESHDEERLMYKNLTYGNTSGSYSVKNLPTALQRMKTAGAFFFTIPGPKMIWQFGELGYDYSIDYNGRLGTKPIPFSASLNYLSKIDRVRLMKTWSALIKLKKDYPAFSSSDFRMSVSGYLKRMWINDPSMNVVVIANFAVFTDTMLPEFQNTGKWYNYFTGEELNVVNADMPVTLEPGEFKIFTTVKLPTPEQGILLSVPSLDELPTHFKLEQNFPNPFNPQTVISYQLAKSGHVSLKVYDVLGREVATLVNEFKQAGNYNSQFSIQNSQFSSGVYFYRIQAGEFSETRKMMLMK